MDDEEEDINEEEVSRSQKETSELAALSILWCRQNVDDLQEDLAKFDYKLNMKVKIAKHPFFFAYLLEPCIERSSKIS
jgi:hypothetical protein